MTPRPANLAGAIALSLALHAALLSWLQPGGRLERLQPEFPLSVRLMQREPEPTAVPPVRPRPAARPAPSPRPPQVSRLPLVEAARAPTPQQPLRLRVVASPADYGVAPASPERKYAWPGEVDQSPLPPEGIAVFYPASALRDGQQGLVVARVEVDRSGRIERLEFVCSAPLFEPAVRDALQAARFRPAFVRNASVPSWLLLEFAFLASVGQDPDPAVAEQSFAALQARCLQDRQGSAQPAR